MNKNVVITILAIMVVGLGGYLAYDKVMQNKGDIKNNIQEEEFDLDEARRLVDIYAGILKYREIDQTYNYENNQYEESYKAMLAYDNVSSSKISYVNDYICKQLTNDDNFCEFGRPLNSVKYEDINTSYRYLFGKQSSLEKKDYARNKLPGLLYIEKEDLYIEYTVWKTSGITYFWGSKVESAKVSGNELKINVLYSSLLPFRIDKTKSPYTETEYGITAEEIQKFVDAEYQYFDKYEFTFVQDVGHYVLKDIIKL